MRIQAGVASGGGAETATRAWGMVSAGVFVLNVFLSTMFSGVSSAIATRIDIPPSSTAAYLYEMNVSSISGDGERAMSG